MLYSNNWIMADVYVTTDRRTSPQTVYIIVADRMYIETISGYD